MAVNSRKETPHGTLSGYHHYRCRCPECRSAAATYERNRARQKARPDGVWQPYVPADEAREHLLALRKMGIGPVTVAKVSGVPNGSITKILYGSKTSPPSRQVKRSTAERILAVNASRVDGYVRIPAGPTWRLLDDLLTQGYTKSYIAQLLTGEHADSIQISKKTVRAETARKVERIHRSLSGRPAPPRRNRYTGRRLSAA